MSSLFFRKRENGLFFELTNAIGQGDDRRAMLVVRQMARAREPVVRAIAMIARHVRQIWIAKQCDREAMSEKQVAARVGIHPFFVSDLKRQAARFNIESLYDMHRAVIRADRFAKSSRLSGAMVLERLVLSMLAANSSIR